MKLPKGRKALLLGIPLGLAVAGGLAFTQLSGGTASAGPPPVPDPTAGQHGVMLALESRVVNLRSGATYHYAKVAVTVELRPAAAGYYALTGKGRAEAEKEAIAETDAALPLLTDAVGTVVSAADPAGLTTPEGRATLKRGLVDAFRAVLGEREVLEVYFTDFVMQ
jgi:flagellar basal body-associated protein FliL